MPTPSIHPGIAHRGVTPRTVVLLAGVLLAALAGCGGTSTPTGPASTPGGAPGSVPTVQQSLQQPVATSEADWAGVANALGRTGKLTAGVYRVPLTRSDLSVVSQGVAIKPGLSLGGYASFVATPMRR